MFDDSQEREKVSPLIKKVNASIGVSSRVLENVDRRKGSSLIVFLQGCRL